VARSAAHTDHFFFFGAGIIESDDAFVVVGAADGPSFFFFGFFTSLFPRIWPLAIIASCCPPALGSGGPASLSRRSAISPEP
jgi:hypothetical protein